MNAKLVFASGNKKTGPIPVSTTDRSSCPSHCVFKMMGCYAEAGPLALWWRKLGTLTGATWSSFLEAVRRIPRGSLWRHNQAGDLPHTDDWIDGERLRELTRAATGTRGFTYTHHRVLGSSLMATRNRFFVREANENGFTVNVSTETRRDADEAVRLGLPVVLAVPEKTAKRTFTKAGVPVLVCPQQYAGTPCVRCGWCAKADRKFIVAFRAHGSNKRKAEEAIKRAQRRRGVK